MLIGPCLVQGSNPIKNKAAGLIDHAMFNVGAFICYIRENISKSLTLSQINLTSAGLKPKFLAGILIWTQSQNWGYVLVVSIWWGICRNISGHKISKLKVFVNSIAEPEQSSLDNHKPNSKDNVIARAKGKMGSCEKITFFTVISRDSFKSFTRYM